MKRKFHTSVTLLLILSLASFYNIVTAQVGKTTGDLDEKVKKFLDDHSREWYDMNIPAVDGQLLYDLIIKGN
jgi:hypothetical protein